MNDQHDHDMAARDVERRLAAFLGDDAFGRAPERAIEGAMAHARAHPRRRDVLAAVRPDPMDGWARVVGLGGPGARSAPGGVTPRLLLVASLGLLLVAAFAVASVGGLFDRPAVVPPDGSPSPVADRGAVAVGGAVADAVAGARGAAASRSARRQSVMTPSWTSPTRRGRSCRPCPARLGTAARPMATSVVVTQGDTPETLVLTWTGLPCTTAHELAIGPDGLAMAMTQPACDGDTIPRDLVLELTFAAPVDAAEVVATLETVE